MFDVEFMLRRLTSTRQPTPFEIMHFKNGYRFGKPDDSLFFISLLAALFLLIFNLRLYSQAVLNFIVSGYKEGNIFYDFEKRLCLLVGILFFNGKIFR